MKFRILTLFILSIFYINLSAQGYLKENSFDFGKIVNPELLPMPNLVSILDQSMLAQALNIDAKNISFKNPKSTPTQKIKSMFYTIRNGEDLMNGVLFQVSTNPVYIEAPDYISFSLDNKLTQGEVVSSTNSKILYKEEYAGKVRFVYSFELGQVYWNIGNNYLFMLGFNGPITSEAHLISVAKTLIPEINKNMLAKLLE